VSVIKLVIKILSDTLVDQIGKENISTEDFIRIAYNRDWGPIPSWDDYKPDIVVRPKSTKHVVEVVKLANKHKIPITPWGGGTGISGGALALKGGILLDTKGLDQIIEIDEASMTVITEAGIIINKLNKELKKSGFMFSHVPVSEDIATIGGTISYDSVGSFACGYGAAGDHVLGLEVVLPKGKIIETGSKVLKSSSGYNLTRLLIGAEGTLGILTKAILKIHPMPEARCTIMAVFQDMGSCIRAGRKLMRLNPEHLEIVDPERGLAYVRDVIEVSVEIRAIIGIGFAGVEKIVDVQKELALEILTKEGGTDLGPEAGEIWFEGRRVPPDQSFSLVKSSYDFNKRSVTVDAMVPLVKLEEYHRFYRETATKHGLKIEGVCLYVTGQPYTIAPSFRVLVDHQSKNEWQKYLEFNDKMLLKALELGGTVTSQFGVGITGTQYVKEEWGQTFEVFRELKKFFDPNNIMNPGKKGFS